MIAKDEAAPTAGDGMTSADELDSLIDAVAKDPAREPELFRILLDSTMYAHAPLNDTSERLRFVLFKSPDDGTLTIPMFTDRGKAEFAARGNVRLVEATGRTLFAATRGANVMINPNDVRCTLYPEEISALLTNGTVAPVQKNPFQKGQTRCFKLPKVPVALVKALRKSLPDIRGVEMAYVAGLKWRQAGQADSLLIVLGGCADKAEREVRATATALQQLMQRLDQPLDVMHFDSSEAKPNWIRRLGLTPVYRRRLGEPMATSKLN